MLQSSRRCLFEDRIYRRQSARGAPALDNGPCVDNGPQAAAGPVPFRTFWLDLNCAWMRHPWAHAQCRRSASPHHHHGHLKGGPGMHGPCIACHQQSPLSEMTAKVSDHVAIPQWLTTSRLRKTATELSGHGHLIGASNEVHRLALRRQMAHNVVPMSQGNGFPHVGCTQGQHLPCRCVLDTRLRAPVAGNAKCPASPLPTKRRKRIAKWSQGCSNSAPPHVHRAAGPNQNGRAGFSPCSSCRRSGPTCLVSQRPLDEPRPCALACRSMT